MIWLFEASRRPSGEKATVSTSSGVSFERAEQLAAWRLPQLHRVVITPAGQHPALRIKRDAPDHVRCPSSVRSSLPLRASHSFTVLSPLPLASVRPCGSNATLLTLSWCPSSVRSSLPLRASQSFTVLSSLPLASVPPCGSNATLQTESCVPFERAQQLAASRLPELHGVVITPAGQRRPSDQTPRYRPAPGALRACGAACRFAPPRASPCCHHSRWPASGPADQTPRSRPRSCALRACGAASRPAAARSRQRFVRPPRFLSSLITHMRRSWCRRLANESSRSLLRSGGSAGAGLWAAKPLATIHLTDRFHLLCGMRMATEPCNLPWQ